MDAALVTRNREGTKGVGVALLVAVLAAVGLLAAPTDASAQITPIPGAGDYCADSKAARFGVTPRGNFNVNVAPAGQGSVTASMWGTQAECIMTPNPCTTNCQIQVMAVCEFHCQHDHIAPYPWTVRFAATQTGSYYFVGWAANCEPIRNTQLDTSTDPADRRDCILRWTAVQPNVNLTAHFAPAPDVLDPAPAPSVTAAPQTYGVNLSWTPSADQWLAGYDLYRNGARFARVSPGTTSFAARNLFCDTTYTFQVVAYDWSAHDAPSTPVTTRTGTCPVDPRPSGPRPNTEIHVKPPKVTTRRRAYFHFGSGTVRATKYQCKLDRRSWRRCYAGTGKRYRDLKKGYHTFRVRAGNANGWDPTPARYRWRIR